MNILILGGYGTFGGRLAHLLAEDERLILLLAGRSLQKARKFCAGLPAGAQKIPVFFDRDADVEAQIREIKADVVVDAMGPFQVYGEDPYRVVKACIANGVNYMDLADGSDFVKGIRQFDEEAKANGIYVLSGVSSFPVLTAAVVRKLSYDMTCVNTIKGGIAPSPYAGVGLNVIRAITSYAGKPVALTRNGMPATGYGLTETMRYTISPPGYLPLHNALFSLVDVPDLKVLPAHWPELDSIWLGAGPVPEVLHRMLIGLSWLVRFRILPSLLPFASLFHVVINILRWGEHRGGMFVSVEGTDQGGKRIERSWHLLAEGNDGPFIPSMAIQALVLQCLAGKEPSAGARPATRELEVSDYEEIFKRRTIYTGQRETIIDAVSIPLYKRILGEAWDELPAPIATLHNVISKEHKAEGIARVETGKHLFARLLAAVYGFPHAGENVPVKVSFLRKGEGELWQRDFAGRKFSTFQSEGHGHADKLLVEKFGLVTFWMALVLKGEELHTVTRRWSIFGIPLPLTLAPNSTVYEYADGDDFCFHVEVKHWLMGLLVRYEGKLRVVN
ncbi:MAG TPA: DUF4166 domain-containing protein [Anaerolineales bacterium]|jgi:hypothetical protein|nr:DUF4166 domain-containing protein [Anaerolineales bacterium]